MQNKGKWLKNRGGHLLGRSFQDFPPGQLFGHGNASSRGSLIRGGGLIEWQLCVVHVSYHSKGMPRRVHAEGSSGCKQPCFKSTTAWHQRRSVRVPEGNPTMLMNICNMHHSDNYTYKYIALHFIFFYKKKQVYVISTVVVAVQILTYLSTFTPPLLPL